MKMTITDSEVTFSYPRWSKRQNPYMEDECYCGEYPTFTGLIIKHKNGVEDIGFAQSIDMDYKGKPDQVGGFLVMWYGSNDDFVKKCKELGVGIQILDFD